VTRAAAHFCRRVRRFRARETCRRGQARGRRAGHAPGNLCRRWATGRSLMSPISCEALLSVGRRPANLRHQAQARIGTAMEAGNRLCHWCDGRDQRPAAPAGPGHQGDGISGGRCSSTCLPPSTMWCNREEQGACSVAVVVPVCGAREIPGQAAGTAPGGRAERNLRAHLRNYGP
jgi:hypothetical protein